MNPQMKEVNFLDIVRSEKLLKEDYENYYPIFIRS